MAGSYERVNETLTATKRAKLFHQLINCGFSMTLLHGVLSVEPRALHMKDCSNIHALLRKSRNLYSYSKSSFSLIFRSAALWLCYVVSMSEAELFLSPQFVAHREHTPFYYMRC